MRSCIFILKFYDYLFLLAVSKSYFRYVSTLIDTNISFVLECDPYCVRDAKNAAWASYSNQIIRLENCFLQQCFLPHYCLFNYLCYCIIGFSKWQAVYKDQLLWIKPHSLPRQQLFRHSFFPHSQTFITPSVSQETNFAGLNLPCFNTAFLAVIIFPNRYYTFGSFRCRCCQDVGSKLYKQTNLSGWNIQPPPLLPLQHRLYFPAFSNPLLLHYGIRSSPSSIPLFLPSALSSTWKEEGGRAVMRSLLNCSVYMALEGEGDLHNPGSVWLDWLVG